jgi:DNA-binding NarL/FixJ family response regulator
MRNMQKMLKSPAVENLPPVQRIAKRGVVNREVGDEEQRRILADFARALAPRSATDSHTHIVSASISMSESAVKSSATFAGSGSGGKPSSAADVLGKHLQRISDPHFRALVSGLPERQQQTLAGLLAGDSEKQIAHRLQLSPHTVHDYVKRLHRALGVSSRGELLSKFIGIP